MRFADVTAIRAETQEELQYMDILVDTGSKYRMEINTDRSKLMRISRRNE